ncbi:TELO2-interacting protein 1 homolog [Topomyia yanbarensis]|uniref:TELO2-interacting protein 1 homolog n=1 Tax=Topomyia yanbarensis TaxID=2498891 RepID=UPI00273B96CE|nr:TELO2-interacting protein 1 homolog [Topomyia yanbarensis]
MTNLLCPDQSISPSAIRRWKQLVEQDLQDGNPEKVQNFNQQLLQMDPGTVQLLQGYYLRALISLLDNATGPNRKELQTTVLECICTILTKSKLREAVALKTILVVLLVQIYDTTSKQLVGNLSEEHKLAILTGLTLASRNIQSDLVEQVYVRDNLNLLSQVLFVCVSIIETERYRKLRFQAIDCILATMQLQDDSDWEDSVLRHQVAELLFIVLPKLLASLVSVINGDRKQGTAVVRMGIKALGRILCLIFEDYEKRQAEEGVPTEEFFKLAEELKGSDSGQTNVLGLGLRNSEAREEYFSNTTRSRDWLLAADKKVHQVLQLVTHLRGAEEDLFRQEYARMNAELLKKCVPNIPISSITILESLLALCQDESKNIRDISLAGLEQYWRGSISIGSSRMDELLYDLLKAIPRSIYRAEETDQVASFALLKGYIKFLPDCQLNVILSNQETLNQLVLVLLAGAELDQTDELVRREYVAYRFQYAAKESGLEREKRESRWIVLRNFQGSDRSQKAFLDMLHSLKDRPESLATVLNYIVEDLFTTKLNAHGYLFLLSELISDVENQPLRCIFRNVFTEILQSYHWELELQETIHVADLKFNVLHICLTLRTVARFCRLFREDFASWQLYDVLRNILPLTGSNLNCINEAAELALDSVASSIGLSSIHELISRNLDYISQYISRCLKRSNSFPAGVHMLESVLRFVPYESSAVLESTVSPIVMNILDDHDQRMGSGRILCLKVLQIFIRAIRFRYQPEMQLNDEGKDDSPNRTKLAEKMAQLKEEIECKLPPEEGATIEELPADDVDDGQAMETETEPDGPYQSEEEKLPPHIRITIKILTVNFKYLASSVLEEKIVALGTLDEGIHLLREHENQLLPMVHQIWFNFAERFADPSPVVVSCAFDLLVTLAQLAKDFIRKRTLDDVLPRLNSFMQSNIGADFSALQTFKLQRTILTHIPELVSWLKLNERQLDQVLNVTKLYLLHRSERRELQQLARTCFDRLAAEYDAGAVFVKFTGV